MTRQPAGMDVAGDTAAVMVTRNGERHLRRQCSSIFSGTMLPGRLVVVDDASTDRTRDLLAEVARSAPIPVELVFRDGSVEPDRKTRIATMVMAGLAEAADFEHVLLADQDDEWLGDRLASQRDALAAPGALLVAGDGTLVDQTGRPSGGTLRDHFPPPSNWDALEPGGRARAVLRRSFATGATLALHRDLVGLMAPIPRGWLHDRWAALVAVARDGLVLQSRTVINYRLHDRQALGLRQADLGRGGRRWRQVLRRGSSPLEAFAHAKDIVERVRPLATDPGIRAELSWPAVLRSAVERV